MRYLNATRTIWNDSPHVVFPNRLPTLSAAPPRSVRAPGPFGLPRHGMAVS